MNDVTAASIVDPRATLAAWANGNDEWVRSIVRSVLSTERKLDRDTIDQAYNLFRQEKLIDQRTLPAEPKLEIASSADDREDPLAVTRLSNVHGVNAITSHSLIELHEGLTILYGENGTGKTGYARIFKALAASRTADDILGNVDAETGDPISAEIDYRVGSQLGHLDWHGENGKAPFTRMSIFDSRAVNIHVDDDIEYVYTPAVLSIFEYVISGLRSIQVLIDAKISELRAGSPGPLLSRFPRDSTVYPLVETLGASSDLEALKKHASTDPAVDSKVEALRKTVAVLETDTLGLQTSSRQNAERALGEAEAACRLWVSVNPDRHRELVQRREELKEEYKKFRSELFASAHLPTEPEDNWEQFVRAGENYRQHLDKLDVHDDSRCLYCRQELSDNARELLTKYQHYIDDKISADLEAVHQSLAKLETPLLRVQTSAIQRLLEEVQSLAGVPEYVADCQTVSAHNQMIQAAIGSGSRLSTPQACGDLLRRVTAARRTVTSELSDLRRQSANRQETLRDRRQKLAELSAAAELTKSWPAIESRVHDAKQADRLSTFSRAIPNLSRAVTSISKDASNQLVNNSFEELFREECVSLRAKELKLLFVGREGKAQRRKIISGKYKPSKVFSEGEQKVLAIADFLAEARLAGIAAPVIFDDPVSSLDYRRVNEVAERIATLSAETQVIVFTHDILFTTKLLSLFEKSKRCTYLHISDENGEKGIVTRATGPRWDNSSKIKGRINEAIQHAQTESGEARDAHIRNAYSWMRSWCEVFIEQDVLQGVTQRLQPNVAMGGLTRIKVNALPDCFNTVTKVFEDACRYIDGHSQPLQTLAVAPTLDGLKADWETLQDCKRQHDKL